MISTSLTLPLHIPIPLPHTDFIFWDASHIKRRLNYFYHHHHHHLGSQKDSFHTRTKFARNVKSCSGTFFSLFLPVSVTKAFTGSLCNGLELTKGWVISHLQNFNDCHHQQHLHSLFLRDMPKSWGSFFALRKPYHCNTSCVKALIFIWIILGMLFFFFFPQSTMKHIITGVNI